MKENYFGNSYFEVAPGVWGMKDIFVNFFMIRNEDDNTWVLVDAGLKTSFPKIKKMAASLFGEGSAPTAIILTHGHFDHVGSLKKLAELWQVPVYAHHLEMPYLKGKSSYPPPDSSVGGGLMAYIADIYPNDPINLDGYVRALPKNHQIPVLPEWRYIHTPGHAPGHISLWRDRDKTLIAGDALVTTKQESALSVIMQSKVISGPPKYFTYDWGEAGDSVRKLVKLGPEIVAAGHGKPMKGDEMLQGLYKLATGFDKYAVPEQGRYVYYPATTDADGVVFVPEKPFGSYSALITIGSVASVLALSCVILLLSKRKKGQFQ